MGTMKRVPNHSIVDEVSGGINPIYTYEEDNNDEKYSIRRLKMTVWQEAYLWVIEQTCRSQKDITLFKILTKHTDRQNLIIIGSMTQFAKENGVSRIKLYDFIKRLCDVGFLDKEAPNTFRVNPYVFISNKAYITSKTAKAMLQVEWSKKNGTPPEPSEFEDNPYLVVKGS